MDTTLLDNDMEGLEEESAKRLLASCSFMNETFGDSQVVPRVGYQYQAEILQVVEECSSLEVVKEPVLDSNVIMNVPNPFRMGLPIPICWIKTEVQRLNGAFEFGNCEERHFTSFDGGLCPLPDSSSEAWKHIERDGFILGLYIFGKNLILVKDFVGSKEMGEILSFYYGKYYRSDEYRRWSECRKLRSRRFIHGQKLFTGWREQELLSRLFSHLSKECQDMLLEASKAFGEGKVPFEEYVFTIKNTVGLGMLIEAVGIGKGKRDLTGNTMEPVKANHVVSFRPEIPIGKACSALTSTDIIKFLKGDFRLSKARTSDLFWEAVWPRLLARGWHSEQPKDQVFSGSKNSLVFIIPGVKKFSRRRLVKGNHYFDSVSDVLNKIASEPGLIELEIEVPEGSIEKKENKCDPVKKQVPYDRYLKPRNSGCNRDVMKFTIIDTSFVQGGEQSKVRELRSLPLEATSLSTPSSISSDSEECISDNSKDEAEVTRTSNATEAMIDEGECVDLSDCVNSNSNISTSSMLNEECFNQPDACEDMVFQTGSKNLSPSTSLSKGSPDADKEGLVAENCLHGEESLTKTESQTLIDLNVPQVSIGFESDGPLITKTVQNSDNSCPNVLFFQSDIIVQPETLKVPDKGSEVNQDHAMHNRRQSTRNRPLTTKALEALECGFFSPIRKRKAVSAPQHNSRRVRKRPVVSALFRNGTSNPNMEES